MLFFFFFFNDTATTEIYTLSLHDALPIFLVRIDRERSIRVALKKPRALTRMSNEKWCDFPNGLFCPLRACRDQPVAFGPIERREGDLAERCELFRARKRDALRGLAETCGD